MWELRRVATPAEELILTQDPAPESGPGIQLFFTICGDKINSCLILSKQRTSYLSELHIRTDWRGFPRIC